VLRMAARRAGFRWWMASPPLLLAALIGIVIGVAVIGVISIPGNNAAASESADSGGDCVSVATGVDASGSASASVGTPAAATTTPLDPARLSSSATAASFAAVGSSPPSGGAGGTDPSDLAGIRLTPTQVQQAQTIVGVGKGQKAGAKEISITLAVAYIQTKFDPSASVANGLGQGLFLETSDAYPGVVRTDPAGSAAAFFTRIAGFEKSGVYQAEESFADMAVSMSIQGVGAYSAADYRKVQTWATSLETLLASGVNPTSGTQIDCAGAAGDNVGWDPGNIISDAVFYNSGAMDAAAIGTFIGIQNAACPAGNPWCLRNLRITDPGRPADTYCGAVTGGANEDAATLIAAYSRACGVNPQVMLTKLQLESQGLNRANPAAGSYDAAWGWNCPDTGAGGSANCDPAHAGFLNQLAGMAKSWAEMKVDIPTHKYNYAVGTYNIMWNVEESGCGAAPVTITKPRHRVAVRLHPVPAQRRVDRRIPRRGRQVQQLRQPELLLPVPAVLRLHRRRQRRRRPRRREGRRLDRRQRRQDHPATGSRD